MAALYPPVPFALYAAMTIQSFTFNPFQTNCYVVHDAGEAVIIDASSQQPQEHRALLDYVEAKGLTVRHLLLTHAHLDHIFGCNALSEAFGRKWQVHQEDLPLMQRSQEQALAFGAKLDPPEVPETFLQEGDRIAFGDRTLQVLHTPGHAPGHVAFFDEEEQVLFSGDVLFQRSIGRTDLPGGSMNELMTSIREKVLPLGEGVRVYPGHGPTTTIGEERRLNPFLQER